MEELAQSVTVKLVGFDRQLERLYPNDFLPRYHRITVEFQNRSDSAIEMLFITVHRCGSKLGIENFYTVPLHVPELTVGRTARYEFLSFDSFNLPFDNVVINMTSPQEYEKRRLAKKYLEKAPDLMRFIS